MRPINSSFLPSTYRLSFSVIRANCCFILPFTTFQVPCSRSLFIMVSPAKAVPLVALGGNVEKLNEYPFRTRRPGRFRSQIAQDPVKSGLHIARQIGSFR